MIHRPKKFIAAMFLASGLASASANAEEKDLLEKSVPEVVYSKKTVLEFSEIQVSAQLVRPEDSYVLVRTRSHFVPLLKIRSDFRPELLRSIDAL